jgi:undecaprenyl-phosphate 4-deoxy-4-formamido-L-arabinose transferase
VIDIRIDISIVIPVYNEEASLEELHRRLRSALSSRSREGRRVEILFVDDGSFDASARIVERLAREDPAARLVPLGRNRGQLVAVLAGLRESRGRHVVTLDADLQNPPEEIPRLLHALESGHDLVTTRRTRRQDPRLRRLASRLSNRLSSWLAGTVIRDHGSMLCGFERSVVDRICASRERFVFLQALALRHARNPVVVAVAHAPRLHGKSRYNLLSLLGLQVRAAVAFRRARRHLARAGGEATRRKG